MHHDPRYDFFYYRLSVLVLLIALGVVAMWPSMTLWFWGLFSRTLRNHLKSTNKPKPLKSKKTVMTIKQLNAANALVKKQEKVKNFANTMPENIGYVAQSDTHGLAVSELAGTLTGLTNTWETLESKAATDEFASL